MIEGGGVEDERLPYFPQLGPDGRPQRRLGRACPLLLVSRV